MISIQCILYTHLNENYQMQKCYLPDIKKKIKRQRCTDLYNKN